jgi:hypothetical protein
MAGTSPAIAQSLSEGTKRYVLIVPLIQAAR